MSPIHVVEVQPRVEIFTDGSASAKTRTGGWAAILRCPGTNQEAEFSGSVFPAKVGQMELQAVVNGLSRLTRPCRVEVTCDSEYVVKGGNEWMHTWKASGWRRKNGSFGHRKRIKNLKLWKQLDELMQLHVVHFTHVRGHTGHIENERCDALAGAARIRGFGLGAPGTEAVVDDELPLGEIPAALDGNYG